MRWALHVLLISLALCASCRADPPAPVAGQVRAAADALLEVRGEDWGPNVHLWAPEASDPQFVGTWWQVDYAAAADGRRRCVLVDAQTAWARLPPPDYRPRILLRQSPEAVVPSTPARIAVGTWILVCEEPHEPSTADADRLRASNARCVGRYPPLFSSRDLRDGRAQIVYGWQDGEGIARDEALASWVRGAGAWPAARWLDLSAR